MNLSKLYNEWTTDWCLVLIPTLILHLNLDFPTENPLLTETVSLEYLDFHAFCRMKIPRPTTANRYEFITPVGAAPTDTPAAAPPVDDAHLARIEARQELMENLLQYVVHSMQRFDNFMDRFVESPRRWDD